MKTYKLKLISNFNIKPLENYLNNTNDKKNLIAETSEYGNIFNNLTNIQKKINILEFYFGLLPKR